MLPLVEQAVTPAGSGRREKPVRIDHDNKESLVISYDKECFGVAWRLGAIS
jgi:hypothetical protein